MLFEEIYNQYFEQIYKFSFRFVYDHEKAMDITQDTFLKLYHRMNSRYGKVDNVKAWLYKVAGNLCLNSIKISTRRSELNNSMDLDYVENTNPENKLIRKEDLQLIKTALNRLKPENKLLLLMYQDGLTYREMSESTGIPFNSIGKTLWRCIEKVSKTVKLSENE